MATAVDKDEQGMKLYNHMFRNINNSMFNYKSEVRYSEVIFSISREKCIIVI